MHRSVDHAMPLLGTHPREDRVIVHACVVHQDLDWTFAQNLRERRVRRPGIRDVEGDSLCAPAAAHDFLDDPLRRLDTLMRMHIDVMAITSQPGADRTADSAAAARDERAFDLGHARPFRFFGWHYSALLD